MGGLLGVGLGLARVCDRNAYYGLLLLLLLVHLGGLLVLLLVWVLVQLDSERTVSQSELVLGLYVMVLTMYV